MLEGKGYRDIYKPGEPIHTLYPFGYPLLLVPVMAVFKGSYVALKMLSLLLGAGSVIVAFLLLRDDHPAPVVWSVSGLFAISPLLLEYSHWILSDVPFLFFSLLGLLLAKRSDTDSKLISPVFLACLVCIAFVYFIRPVGAALILGFLLHLFLRKKHKRGLIALAVFGMLLAPWAVRNAKASGGEGYIAPMVLKDPYDATSGMIGVKDLIERVGSNAETYFLVAFPKNVVTSHRRIWPFPRRSWDMYVAGFAISALVLAGFAADFGGRMGLTHYYLIFFVGTLLVWPEVWATDRFILPVVPFLLLYFLLGGLLLFRKATAPTRRKVGLVVVTVLALGSLHLVARGAPGNLQLIREYSGGNRFAGYTADWINFYETAAYASRFTPSDAVFMVRKPGLFYLFADRKCVAYPFTPEKDAIMAAMDEYGVSYVVVDAFAWTQTTLKYLVPALVAHEEDFAIVYSTGAPRTLVLRRQGG